MSWISKTYFFNYLKTFNFQKTIQISQKKKKIYFFLKKLIKKFFNNLLAFKKNFFKKKIIYLIKSINFEKKYLIQNKFS
jgi:hypothetical protein